MTTPPASEPIGWYRTLWPLIRHIDPETAHRLALRAIDRGWVPGSPCPSEARLRVSAMNLSFPNPIGLAAGFDKNAVIAGRLAPLGFGFGEVGGVTPLAQSGNPRPRMFRLDADGGAINRMGFNNDGSAVIAARLARLRDRPVPIGVNLASNTDSDHPAQDFVHLVGLFAPLSDYLTIDVSCPNTKNGRMFQDAGRLRDLLDRLLAARGDRRTPMLVKIAADLTQAEAEEIAAVTVDKGLDGLVVANTSGLRPDGLLSQSAPERGGLSGRPIFAASTALLAAVRRAVGPAPVLIGVGGIFTGEDAYAKIRAGANLVQLYTGLAYRGPGIVPVLCRELSALLARDGFAGVADAVSTGL